jgi:DNA-binding MarR family transcriptional regulator
MTARAAPAGQRPAVEPAADLGVVDGLVQLSFLVHSLVGRIAGAHDLSVIQTRLLGVLRDREIGMLELARILELEKSSVTGLVDRAERRGLVQRIPVAGNRRAVRVILTPAGHALARAVHDDVTARIGELVAGLSPAQQGRLSRLTTSLILSDAAERAIPL